MALSHGSSLWGPGFAQPPQVPAVPVAPGTICPQGGKPCKANCGLGGRSGGFDWELCPPYAEKAVPPPSAAPAQPESYATVNCKGLMCLDRDCSYCYPSLQPKAEPGLKPRLLIIGHGRHGKDTVAEILRDDHGYSFASSSFFAAEMAVRPAMEALGKTYDSLDECYADRVNHRGFWYEAISMYNGGGKSRLAEAILEDHDCYVGMRSAAEYAASRALFDVVVWVDASGRGLPHEDPKSFDILYDPTTMYRIANDGSLDDLGAAVDQLALALSWWGLRAPAGLSPARGSVH